ncbi:hypothetical protein CS8_000270 [Cupriavidus sp. 8B]
MPRFRSDRVQAHHHVLRAFLNHELVAQFNFLGDRYAILGDQRGPVRPLKNNSASLGTKHDLNRVGQQVDTRHDAAARGLLKSDLLGCHDETPREILAFPLSLFDDAQNVFLAHDQQFRASELDGGARILAE